MLCNPGCGSKVRQVLDTAISESGKNRGQIVAHWEFQPAAAFHDRENATRHSQNDFCKKRILSNVTVPILLPTV